VILILTVGYSGVLVIGLVVWWSGGGLVVVWWWSGGGLVVVWWWCN